MSKTIRVRMLFILIIVGIVGLTIIGKVFYIEVINYHKLSSLANDLWSRNLPITADRGLILDRNGKVLADNVTTTSLVLIPNQIVNKEEVTKVLSEILNVDYDTMKKHVYKKTSIERVHPEGRQLSFEIADKINSFQFDGVYLLKESKRYYPYNELLSHSLGYVGIDNQGLSGLELLYDKYLTGINGSIKYYSDGKGNRIPLNEVYNAPESGYNLTLTIDLDLQKSIERELNNIVSKYDPEHALILVENPKTGEILGMGSRPSFNPNEYQTSSVETINRNLPIWMTYEPGSTFKIITLAASIEEKTVDIFNDHFYDGGSIKVENAKIKCWKPGGHGSETFLNVVENSCNPGFVVLGQRLGKERLFSYINNFGFNTKTGIDLNGEAKNLIFNIDKVGPVELATTAFGQGISVTPISQVNSVSAVINGGNLLKPYIVKSINDSKSNTTLYENKTTVVRENVISKSTSDLVRFALESVVANGTGRNAYIENYRVGGKTGTAQKVKDGRYMVGNYILSFIGFMPADDPEIVVYVAIDNPKRVVQYGGTVSAPVAKRILSDAAAIFNIREDPEGMPKVYNFWDQIYEKIPNVVGLDLNEAKKQLKGYKLEYSGNGSKVLRMNPEGNNYVKQGSTIKLFLDE